MIGEGVKVLIIDSIDAASGAGVEKQADQAGVKVIDYDRVNLGGTAPYYVSFDNEDVGKLQAPDPGRLPRRAGRRQPEDHHDGRRHRRRQQRRAVRQGRPRGARPAGRPGKLTIVSGGRRQGLERRERRPGLHPGAHRRRRSGRRRARRERRHRQRGHRCAEEQRPRRPRRRHRSGRRRRRVCRTSSTGSRA